MKKLHNLYKNILAYLADWFRPTYRTVLVDDELPKELKPQVLYVVQEDGYQEQAALLCPCGCKEVINLNLLEDERPCWRVKVHPNKTATLHPSVWRKRNCASHFWFRKGKVTWCSKGVFPPKRRWES